MLYDTEKVLDIEIPFVQVQIGAAIALCIVLVACLIQPLILCIRFIRHRLEEREDRRLEEIEMNMFRAHFHIRPLGQYNIARRSRV